ncbi:aryl-alcohol dehydrogenase-like predicted oxidoreductase [Planotetraspora sp. GP83]
MPSWYAARAQTYAETHSLVPVVSLQLPYSLIDRAIELEHVAMGLSLGLGITARSPLGGGFLTGKYRSADQGLAGDGRLSGAGSPGRSWTEREWRLLAAVESVADKLGVTMAQVALNWVATQPGVASAIVGASSADQLDAKHGGPRLRTAGRAARRARRGEFRAAPVGLPDVHARLSELAGQSGRQGRGQACRVCPRRTELGTRKQRLTDFACCACG